MKTVELSFLTVTARGSARKPLPSLPIPSSLPSLTETSARLQGFQQGVRVCRKEAGKAAKT